MQTIDDRSLAARRSLADAWPDDIGRVRGAADERPGPTRRRSQCAVAAPVADPHQRSLAMLAHATRSDGHVTPLTTDPASTGEDGDGAALAVAFIRYLDIVLVLASTPFVLLTSLPKAGFAIGAAAWIVTRLGVAYVERHAWSARDFRVRAALHLVAILGRVWLVGLAVLVARFAIGIPDGIAAAVVVLAAFTVELVVKVVLRGPITAGLRRPS
jgi:hypothetical protein